MTMLRRMAKRFCALLGTAALLVLLLPAAAGEEGLALTEEERAYIASAPVLRVGYVQDRIPVSFTDSEGSLGGVSRFIFDRIAQISGLRFEYVPLPGGAVTYDYLTSERIDLVSSVEFNRENQRARGIIMSDPYLTCRKVIVARNDFSYSREDAHSVALCTGSQTLKKALNAAYPNYTLVDYDTIDACFAAVKTGKTDMMILNQYVAEYWLYKPSYEELKVIPVLGMDEQLCFSAVVPFDEQGNPVGTDGETLADILNKAIATIPEGETDTYTIRAIMENRYSFTVRDFLYRYRFSLIILAVALLLIAGLVALLLRQRLQSIAARADARAKNQFLSTMSHEIRTPLNGLIGLNRLMASRLDDREQMRRYLQLSTNAAHYLQSLVSDMLDMSMLSNQDVHLEIAPVDLRMLLAAVESIVQSGMAEKKLTFAATAELPVPVIAGDAVRIQQVLLNLLDNARKFTPEGGRVTVETRQAPAADGRTVTEIAVSDTGRGMSEAEQKDIFDAFVQNRDTVSKGDQGVGLGLTISRRLARLMEGDLTCASAPGQGSRFVFTFTAAPAELAAPAAAPEKKARPRVLIAEDNELNGEIMLELLSENGFEARLAADGKQALELFSASRPGEYGVILMDLLMPVMDGFAAALAIRALKREDAASVRILACSANCTAEDRRRALASGMDDFLAKPVDIETLLRRLCE